MVLAGTHVLRLTVGAVSTQKTRGQEVATAIKQRTRGG